MAAELLLVLEYLLSREVVHRDIKGENIMLTKDGHIKLVDFGASFAFDPEMIRGEAEHIVRERFPDCSVPPEDYFSRGRKSSFVGTPHYLSPELILHAACEEPADMWAFGVLLYYMLVGEQLFSAQDQQEVEAKICEGEFSLDESKLDKEAVSLLRLLLQPDPLLRPAYSQLKTHPFFREVNWETVFAEESPLRARTCNKPLRIMERSSLFSDEPLQEVVSRLTGPFLPCSKEFVVLCEQRRWVFYYPVVMVVSPPFGSLVLLKAEGTLIGECGRASQMSKFGSRGLELWLKEGGTVRLKAVSMDRDALYEKLVRLGFGTEVDLLAMSCCD